MSESQYQAQHRICRTYGAAFDPPLPGTKVGVAIQTLDRTPLHGVRLRPTETTCGWFVHAGDECSDTPDFYQPLCVEHLVEYCQLAIPFLCLPAGWRFTTDAQGFINVWQDVKIVD